VTLMSQVQFPAIPLSGDDPGQEINTDTKFDMSLLAPCVQC